MSIFFDRNKFMFEDLLKSKELYSKYLETGNEFYKILSEYYKDIAENMLPSKLFRKI